MRYALFFLFSFVVLLGTSCERHDAKVLEKFEHGEAHHGEKHDAKSH